MRYRSLIGIKKYKNLIKYPYWSSGDVVSGVTFTVQDDGGILVQGTAAVDIRFTFQMFTVESGVDYVLSGCPSGGSDATFYLSEGSAKSDYVRDTGAGKTFKPGDSYPIRFHIVVKSGTVMNHRFYPQLEKGTVPTSYEKAETLIPEYGVRWAGTSFTVCERLGDAAGLVANAHKGSVSDVTNDFDNIYPWCGMKTCNVDEDGNVLAYLGEPSFARDGTNGDVMVEIPKFYYRRIKTGAAEELWICKRKLPGYELHPLFIDNGKEVSKVFHSAYNVSSYVSDGTVKLQSITGVQPRVRTTRAAFRTYARNKGAIWGIEDVSCMNALQLLCLVEYADTDSQKTLGSGASALAYTANHKALEETANGNTITVSSEYKNVYKTGQRIEIGTARGANNKTATPRTVTAVATDEEAGQTTITFDGDPVTVEAGNMIWNVAPLNGSCDALSGKSGYLAGENNYADGYADVNYRGIEGFHAKLYRFVDGVNIKEKVVYYANSIKDYADGVYDGKYRAVGYSNSGASGYVSAFGYDEEAPWVMFPSEVNGSASTFVPDVYYQNSGECSLVTGNALHNGTAAGAFCFGCDNPFSYTTCVHGAHLIIKKE